MSGPTEASFSIEQAERLSDGAVAERVRRLFSVEVVLAPGPGGVAAGTPSQGSWVILKTANGRTDNTEKAKRYIQSLCAPESVEECLTDQQSVEQLLSEGSKLREALETEYQTAILPSSSSSSSSPSSCRVCVRGYDALSVQKTMARIQEATVPPSLPVVIQTNPTPPSIQSRPTTAGTFSPSPPLPPTINLSSTSDTADVDRASPHRPSNTPTPDERLSPSPSPSPSLSSPRQTPMTEKEKLMQRIASEIEKDTSVLARGVDSSHREQKIQYFISLNFPREKIEAVVNSMGPWAEYDDILQRLTTLNVTSSRPLASLQKSREYTDTGEPLLNSNATLRPVVIDGSNVAMRHGNGRVFSCRGIEIAVDWFRKRGHKEITVFVPQWRRESSRAEYPITDQEILNQLERDKTLVFTPSRRIGNKRIVCYDDRFIVKLASETNGVIVSNDNFRDLAEENEKWRKTIENRLVMFTFVNDRFMVPEDPLGKHGPRLSQLLQMEPTKTSAKMGGAQSERTGPAICPYGERCTFGRRCRFYHPERDILTSRSPNASPAPPERRQTTVNGSGEDVQKDSPVTQSSERLSPPGSGPSGQPTHSSPQRPRTSPSLPAGPESYGHPPPPSSSSQIQQPPPSSHGYSQPHSLSHGYPPVVQSEPHYSHSQPHGHPHHHQGYPQQPPGNYPPPGSHSGLQTTGGGGGGQNPPLFLGIPPTSSPGSLSPQQQSSVHHSSPGRSNPSTPMGSGGGSMASYPSRTFPIANLSVGRPRNVTDRVTAAIPPSGSEEFVPAAPNLQPPIVPPPPHHHPHHHHGLEPPPGLVPRGDYSSTHYPPPPPPPSHSHSYHPHSGNPHSVNPHSVNRHTVNPQTVNPHPGNPSHEYYQSYNSYSSQPVPHHTHHAAYHHMHANAYPPPPPHPPSTANPHPQQQQQLYSHLPPADYQAQHHHPPPPSHHHQHRGGGGGGGGGGGEQHHHNLLQGPRAASMYGDMGMRRHHDQIAAADKFQSSVSSPELYRDYPRYDPQSAAPPPPPLNGVKINWALFKQAQERLPNREEDIMWTIQQHPNTDLEGLVELIQRPVW